MSKNWAICIGINQYHNLQPLKYAVQDAASLRDFFLQEVQFEQVYYFADNSPLIETPKGLMRSHPTYTNLKRFFRQWFQADLLSTGDNLWFFFAGHGEIHEGHDYLLPIDVDPGNIPETALRVSDIADSLRNCGADNAVMLVDACRDRGKRGPGFGTEEQSGLITIYSCGPNKSSYEIEALQHGSFTYALLEGLQLQGANNCATVERLDQYLCAQVPALNAHYGRPHQRPRISVEPRSKSHLILIPQQATRLQDVQVLKNDAYSAELDGNLMFAQQLWVRVWAASPADQDAVKAIGRIAIKQAEQASIPPLAPATAGSRNIVDLTGEAQSPTPSAKPSECLVPTSSPVPSPEKRYRRIDLGKGVSLELAAIPGGTFMMGSAAGQGYNSEHPHQHSVTISPFEMGKYPVTQSQWKIVSTFPQIERELEAEPSRFKGGNLPVERVSWYDVAEFCQRLSKHWGQEFRLPSEAEWEYACRAGTTTLYYFGNSIASDQVNCDFQESVVVGKGFLGFGQRTERRGTRRGKTTVVGKFSANAFGLYDMHGNVWEWCVDHWHASYQGAPTDNSAWLSTDATSSRLRRGGAWNLDSKRCYAAYRLNLLPENRYYTTGFRVCCSAPRTLA